MSSCTMDDDDVYLGGCLLLSLCLSLLLGCSCWLVAWLPTKRLQNKHSKMCQKAGRPEFLLLWSIEFRIPPQIQKSNGQKGILVLGVEWLIYFCPLSDPPLIFLTKQSNEWGVRQWTTMMKWKDASQTPPRLLVHEHVLVLTTTSSP